MLTSRPSVNYRTTHEDRNCRRPCSSCPSSIIGFSCRPSACSYGYYYSHYESGKVGSYPSSVFTSLICFSRPASRGIRRARGRARKGTERPQKSAADLDAEMEVCVACLGFAMHHPDEVIGLHCKQRGCSCGCPCRSLSNVLFAAV